MKYYVTTTEQKYPATEGGSMVEYMTKSDPRDTEKTARSLYLDTVKNINDNLSDHGHAYALIELRNSLGVLEKYVLGEYVDNGGI